tara:strand:- start:130 stop:732 length:603 start_codon:yes stop_codon:yes gene_type:complete
MSNSQISSVILLLYLTMIKRLLTFIFSLIFLQLNLINPNADDNLNVGGFTFEIPENWHSEVPASPMRKAQFSVKGDGNKSFEIGFFYFGNHNAGGVNSNILRWFYQFKEEPHKLNVSIDHKKINNINITYVLAYGTYLKGIPLRKKTPIPNCQLLGAIVEGKQGTVFIKAVGDKKLIKKNELEFKKMIKEAINGFFESVS